LKAFKYSTRRLFTWQEILASFGGLVGLCTGFSFLSLAELVYFFTLRCTLPICRRRASSNQIFTRMKKVSPAVGSDVIMVKVHE